MPNKRTNEIYRCWKCGQIDELYKQFTKAIGKVRRLYVDCARNTDISISPYEENEKRVIGGKIVNVTYRKIDWKKNFAAVNKCNKNT